MFFPIVQATWDIEQNKMTMEMQLNACVILNAHNNNIIKFSNIIIPMSFLWKCLRSVSETSWFIDITGPFIHNSISASNKRNFKRKSGFKWAASQAIKISIMVEKTKHTEDDSQWYPPLYFLMSRKVNISISPINICRVAIQYAVKLIVGIIINYKYWIA